MTGNAEARLSALDGVLDAQVPNAELADELFSAVDALAGSPSLRRALTNQGTPVEARSKVVRALMAGKISSQAISVVEECIRLNWSTSGAFLAALERQGVRAVLAVAQRGGRLDEVEDQLFKVGRAVAANADLRVALSERRVPVAGRQELIDQLLTGRVEPQTRALARRAVVARERTFDLTLEGYLNIAAELRNRGIATVEVARPLSEEQTTRIRAALSRSIGREITLNVVVNPAVIGGVRVSMGDEVIEGTVAGRLSDVRRKLS